jgi:hypothetical protein
LVASSRPVLFKISSFHQLCPESGDVILTQLKVRFHAPCP